MKLAALIEIGCVLCAMLVPTTADCESASQCFADLEQNLFAEIDTKDTRNPMGFVGRIFDEICEEREDIVECYSSFTSCNLYKQNLTLPTSRDFSKGLKFACDQKRTVNSECPGIGLSLLFFGNHIENKRRMLNMTALGQDTYIDITVDSLCQEKSVFAKGLESVIGCKTFQRYLNIPVQESTFDEAVDLMCRNKEVFVQAEKCALTVQNEDTLGDLTSLFPCLMEFYNSMSAVKSQEEICNKLREVMDCCPLIRKVVLCRKEIYELLMQMQDVTLPCADVFMNTMKPI